MADTIVPSCYKHLSKASSQTVTGIVGKSNSRVGIS